MDKPGKVFQWIGIGAIYILVCFGLKQTNFYIDLASGIRLAALLMLPTRFWPALLLCDATALALFTAPRMGVHPFTTASAIITIAGYPLTSIPAALFGKKVGFDLKKGTPRQFGNLLIIAALAALVGTAAGVAYVLSCDMTLAAQKIGLAGLVETYAVGKVLGTLAIVPAGAFIVQAIAGEKGKPRAGAREILTEVFSWTAPIACILLIVGVIANATGPGRLLLPLRLSMFLAIVIYTLRHGARGASISVLLVNVAIELTQQVEREPDLATIHELSVLLSMIALLIGAHVTRHQKESREAANDAARLMAEAQIFEAERMTFRRLAQNHADLPQRLIEAQAGFLDELLEGFSQFESQLRTQSLDREEAQQLWWRVSSKTRRDIRDKLDSLRPALLETYGLRAALASGPIAAALDSAGIPFYPYLRDDLSHLPRGTQFAVYQLAHGCIARHLQARAAACVTLRIKAGRWGARSWVGILVSIGQNPAFEPEADLGLDTAKSIQKLAQAYGGRIKDRNIMGRRQVSAVILTDDLEAILPFRSAATKASA